MDKLTKIETMEKMILLWGYLAKPENVNEDKEMAYEVLQLRRDHDFCPCCQYAQNWSKPGSRVDCSHCLLLNLWPAGCTGSKSYKISTPYIRWLTGGGRNQATNAAKEILVASQKKLYELRREVNHG